FAPKCASHVSPSLWPTRPSWCPLCNLPKNCPQTLSPLPLPPPSLVRYDQSIGNHRCAAPTGNTNYEPTHKGETTPMTTAVHAPGNGRTTATALPGTTTSRAIHPPASLIEETLKRA